MKRALVPGGLASISFALFLSACGGGSADGTDAAGVSVGDAADGAAGGSTGTAGGAAGGSTGTAGGTAGRAGGAGQAAGGAGGGAIVCNNLSVTGDFISQTVGTGTAPVPAGGTIADGTYVLTKLEVYPPVTPNPSQVKVTFKVTGTELQWVVASSIGAVANQTYTTATSGTYWVLTGVCPSDGITPVMPPGYTASAATLILFFGTQVQTYTKQ